MNHLTTITMIGLIARTAFAQSPISFSSFAAIPLASSRYFAPGITPYSFATGDFNGDGLVDIVLSSSEDVLLLLNHRGGVFEIRRLGFLANGDFTGRVLVGDVNGDKKLDLVIARNGAAFLLFGNGDGSFQPPKAIPDIPLALSDFTGDKKLDLLANCPDLSGMLAVYPGNGDGTFGLPLKCAPLVNDGDFTARTIIVSDFNGDGRMDVAWTNIRSSSRVFVWLGRGDGTFLPPASIEADTGQGTKPIAIGDFNKDGKPDLAVGAPGAITVLLGNGDGTFQSLPTRNTGVTDIHFLEYFDGITSSFPVRSWFENNIFVDDFDGDGNPDILIDDVVFRGNGDGTFQPPQYISTGSPKAISVACVDLDGDGKKDIVFLPSSNTSASANTTLTILRNSSPNTSPNNKLAYSAATGANLVAPSSFASIFGDNLSKQATATASPPYPTQLAGVSVKVRDSTNTMRLAPLTLVSPKQINFLVPPGTSIGPAVFYVEGDTPQIEDGAMATVVLNVAAGFFTLSQDGKGIPAATAVRVSPGGAQEAVPVFSCPNAGQCTATPIDLSSGLPVYLTLYGTGFGPYYANFDPARFSACEVGGKTATVQFIGPHPTFPGLDQLNLLLPRPLPSGPAAVVCQFRPPTNTVFIAIK